MRNFIYILLFIQSFFCFAQEPPAIFKLKYSLLDKDSINLIHHFKIDSPSLKYYKKTKNNYLTDEYWENYKDRIRLDEKFMYINMGNPFPRKNDIIILNIVKNNQSTMSILIKINFDLDYGEKLYLKELNFEEGNYFIDLSHLNNTSLNDYDKKEIDLSKIKKHRISLENLTKKLSYQNCN